MIMKRILFGVLGFSTLMMGAVVSSPNPAKSNIPFATQNTAKSTANNANIGQAKYMENEIIVKYKKNISLSQVASSMANKANINIGTTFDTLGNMAGNVYTVVKSKTLSTQELLNKLNSDPSVEYAEPNYIYYPSALPNDTYVNLLWGQNNTGQTVNGQTGTVDADMNAPEAWVKSTGSSEVVIAVIDTGVDYKHEDLADNMWINPGEIPGNGIDDDNNGYIDDVHGIDAVLNNGDPMDETIDNGGHGTHVAGTIAAVGNNGKGVVGVSWKSKIMALKFLSAKGGDTANAIQCLNYMIAQKNAGVNIVASNNSWGGGGYSNALHDAIVATNNAGILFMAAAGNGGDDQLGDDNDATPHYPASYELTGIVSVAATDHDDILASFSNYGKISVDLSAPGTNIASSIPRTYTPGTSDIFFDDMENGMGNWTTGETSTWAISTDQEDFTNANYPVPSPSHFLSDSPSVSYPSNKDWWVALKNDIDLSSYSEDLYIGFGAAIWISQNSDGSISDYATIEVSKDGGSTWLSLYNLGVYARYWINPYIVKIPDDYKTENFRLRFRMKTTTNDGKPGWLVDNVGIGTVQNENAYGYKNGTSMATPQVSGAVALRASVCPDDSADNIRTDILATVDTINDLTGKVSTDGRLNVNTLINKECAVKKQVPMSPVYYLLF